MTSTMTTVATLDEVDQLPAGAVVRDANDLVLVRALDGIGAVWRAAGSGRNWRPDQIALPARVLDLGTSR